MKASKNLSKFRDFSMEQSPTKNKAINLLDCLLNGGKPIPIEENWMHHQLKMGIIPAVYDKKKIQ